MSKLSWSCSCCFCPPNIFYIVPNLLKRQLFKCISKCILCGRVPCRILWRSYRGQFHNQAQQQLTRRPLPRYQSESVKSLFIFDIFEETLRSMVLSPISTINPPLISGFTLKRISLCKQPQFMFHTNLRNNLQLFALTILRLCHRSF